MATLYGGTKRCSSRFAVLHIKGDTINWILLCSPSVERHCGHVVRALFTGTEGPEVKTQDFSKNSLFTQQ